MSKDKFNFMSNELETSDKSEHESKFKKEDTKNTKYFLTPENQKKFIALLFAIAGLVGLHFKVEYSGWLLFFALLML
jgi:hypothetical protein